MKELPPVIFGHYRPHTYKRNRRAVGDVQRLKTGVEVPFFFLFPILRFALTLTMCVSYICGQSERIGKEKRDSLRSRSHGSGLNNQRLLASHFLGRISENESLRSMWNVVTLIWWSWAASVPSLSTSWRPAFISLSGEWPIIRKKEQKKYNGHSSKRETIPKNPRI